MNVWRNKENHIWPGRNSRKRFSGLFTYFLILSLVSVSISIQSCSNEQEQNEEDPENIREQISEYNERISQLNQEIIRLENKLEEMGELPASRRPVPVTVTEIERQQFDHYILVNASVEAMNEAVISPEISGQIEKIFASRGQRVKKGQLVVRLNSSVIENNMEEVKTSLKLAETIYKRQKSLWDQQIGSEVQYLEAENNLETLRSRLQALEAQLDMTEIRSPINGVVDEIFSKEGELAMPGVPVVHILNLDQLFVNANVSESYLPMVSENQQVVLQFPAYPDYKKEIKIFRIGNVINPENRTFKLQLKIDNQQGKFKPNMMANMAIKSFSTDSAIVVPSILLKQDVQGYYVFLANKDELQGFVARKNYVERHLDSEGKTMISSGLKAGDLLIRQGHTQVNEGERIMIQDPPTSN